MAKMGLGTQNSNAMEWTVHPIKRNWKTSAVVISFLVILCTAIYFSFDSAIFLLLSVVILFSSLARFFFPTTYIFRDDCIIVRFYLRRISRQWEAFKSYYPDKNGVLLSPFPTVSRLENFRGLYIRFNHNRSDVLDFIERKMKERSIVSSQ